jgi:response regulator RpfG family c-di-GMP phosphodiesterase
MQTIVIIDTNDVEARDIDEFLTSYKYKTVRIHEIKKGVELTKSVIPELIVIAIESNDRETMAALTALRKDPITRDIPIIPTIRSNDRNLLENIRKAGIHDYFVKPVNKVKFIEKIKSLLIVAREQKKDNIIFRKNHIVIENPTDTITLISFKSGMKYVLPEIRNIFNNDFLKSIVHKSVSLDIRDLPDLIKDELQIIEKIISLFGNKKISIIAGKHMGFIISSSNLVDTTNLFLSLDDYVAFLKKQAIAQTV